MIDDSKLLYLVMIWEVSVQNKAKIITVDGQSLFTSTCVTNPKSKVFLGRMVTNLEFFKLIIENVDNFNRKTTLIFK